MSKLETPMIERFWARTGGTLIPEFQVVPRSSGVGRRLVDAVILPDLPRMRAHWREFNVAGQHLIVVQAKAHRLGMCGSDTPWRQRRVGAVANSQDRDRV